MYQIMDWKRTKDSITRFFEWVSEPDDDLDVPLSGANFILYLMRLVFTVSYFVICCTWHGRFFSGIDYAAHGVWGWIGLWFSCAFVASIISMATMWVLKITPRMKPRWDYFAFGMAFLVLFVGGVSRHLPNPVIGEISVGAAATLLLYVSLFVEKH